MIPEVTSSSQQAPEENTCSSLPSAFFLVMGAHCHHRASQRCQWLWELPSNGDGWPVGRQSRVFWDKSEAYLPCIVEFPCRTEPHLSLVVSALWAHILLASFPSLPHFFSPLPVFSGVTSCTSRIMAPKRCLCPDPETCEYATLHGKGTLHMWVKLRILS